MILTVIQTKPAPLAVKIKGNDVKVIANTPQENSGGGVTVHGLLTGRDADDHLQYHTDARGDLRYYSKAYVDAALANISNSLTAKADLVGGVVPVSQIPAIALVQYLGPAADQAAMLALVGQSGDWCIRTDLNKVYVITGADPTQLADWTAFVYPVAGVWGTMTGTLSDQTDLWTQLNAKQLTSNLVTSISGASTDAQYGSAKLLYDITQLLAPKASPSFTGTAASISHIFGSGNTVRVNTSGVNVGSSGYFGFSSLGDATSGAAEFGTYRRAAHSTIRHGGTNAQLWALANTWTDASTNEYGGLRWVSNNFELFTDKTGTGTYRDLWILAGNSAGHRLKVSGSIIQDYYAGTSDARAGMNLDSHFSIFAQTGGVTQISSANSSMTGQATLQLTSNTNTVTTQIIQPNVKDGGGGYTGAGHHLRINAGKGAAGNNNGGDLIFYGGDPTGTGVRGSVRFNNLPTSSAGLTTGAIWNNAGVINIV